MTEISRGFPQKLHLWVRTLVTWQQLVRVCHAVVWKLRF